MSLILVMARVLGRDESESRGEKVELIPSYRCANVSAPSAVAPEITKDASRRQARHINIQGQDHVPTAGPAPVHPPSQAQLFAQLQSATPAAPPMLWKTKRTAFAAQPIARYRNGFFFLLLLSCYIDTKFLSTVGGSGSLLGLLLGGTQRGGNEVLELLVLDRLVRLDLVAVWGQCCFRGIVQQLTPSTRRAGERATRGRQGGGQLASSQLRVRD